VDQPLLERCEKAFQVSDLVKCPYCAELIQPDAKKCRHCGEWLDPASRPTSPSSEPEPRYEVCEIGVGSKMHFLYRTYWFGAEVIGPEGQYVAAESPSWNIIFFGSGIHHPPFACKKKSAAEAHHELVEQLTQDGWNPTDRGEWWWQQRFRRKAEA
jgi:hypothetical protein